LGISVNETDSSADEKKIRQAAMNMLARREYCRRELEDKLSQRFADSFAVTLVVNRLRTENLQSDSRYVEAFVRSKIARGQGFLKIQAQLLHKGIDEELFKNICLEMQIDWNTLAKQVASRKIFHRKPTNHIERSKIIRFLQYRGFTLAEAMKAMDEFCESN
tara:strand:+ start:1511 stop:1996 length:486 start_codon:yes stop_codon:yes gene_type:complete